MNNLEHFYVYGLKDPRNMQVFYIGKGKGNRAIQHLKETIKEGQGNHSKIKLIQEIINSGLEVIVHKYITDVNEEIAYYLEEILIDRIGREILNYGPLTNITVGGLNEGKLVFGLEDNQKISVESAILKYPILKSVIDNIPRTTKEDNIKKHFSDTVKEMCQIINSIDPKILKEIGAKEIKFLKHYKKKAIQFECNYGDCEISFDTTTPLEMKGKSSIYIRKNGNIIFESSRNLSQIETIKELREYKTVANN